MTLRELFQQIADAIRYAEGGGEAVNITWDGDTTGLTYVVAGSGATFYKVSDRVFSDEEIKAGTLESVQKNADGEVVPIGEIEISAVWDRMVSEGSVTEDAVQSDAFVFVRKANATIFGVTFPEVGVYFAKIADAGVSIYVSSFTTTIGSSAPICALDFPARIRALKGGAPETITITWDGDTTGKWWYEAGVLEGMTIIACKVSDLVLTDEEIKAGRYTQTFWDETIIVADIWDELVSEGKVTEDYVAMEGITFIRKDNTLLPSGFVAPEKGVYYMSADGTVICNNFTTTRGA